MAMQGVKVALPPSGSAHVAILSLGHGSSQAILRPDGAHLFVGRKLAPFSLLHRFVDRGFFLRR
jgi:hypothetical protein